MIKTDTWWESLFSGDLSIGLSLERQQELEDEGFLYLQNTERFERQDELTI
ncbi:hypothetical protein M2M59_03765 [Rummeliibacillus sp. G93]|uniref:hypothetical protein n=1 Tax=Rummeliibacillus TaxID=648802 RepID=UPI001168652A|nr:MULTISPECIES: hypothetical protein [Rummeliibacillus]MBB5170070.1 hypothetical protein [Rummeliibacillus stabekisii]MCM3315629.1 hypothetical protein [Rummeliibacillus stabekisii]UQW98135.1 hypothetical protein M2M59_03765 [Rummeliibacillus sp. G93]GEL04329.1 hypothetical protein RST01_09560 [Rummeliibacillus stabekisii]